MRCLRVLPFVVVMAVILFAGLKPEPVPQLFAQQDKLHHVLGFAALAFTLHLAAPRLQFVWILLISVAIASMVEFGQGFSLNRTASIADMQANFGGVLLGWVFSILVDALVVIKSTHKDLLDLDK